MKDMKRHDIALLLFALIFVILFFLLRGCGSGNKVCTVTKADTIIKVDTITITKEIYTPKYTTVTVEVPKYITKTDTVRIVENYFEKKFYADTIKDSVITIFIHDTVYMNSIVSRSLGYEFLSTQKEIVTPSMECPKKRRYFGAGITYISDNSVFVNAGIKFKDENSLVAGYDLHKKEFQITLIKYFTKDGN